MRHALLVITFVGVLLLVLTAGHVYLAQRLVVDTGLAPPARTASLMVLTILAATLVLQPIGDRFVPRHRMRTVSWTASVWMGFAFYLLVLLFATDALALLLGAFIHPGPAVTMAARVRALGVLALAGTAGIIGLRAARRDPALRRVEIDVPRWPAALDGFRIVQLSDLHLGPLLDRRFAATVVAQANALAPDLIAITGDLVDGSVDRLAGEVAPFADLRARHGVFFVTGNHDYYSGAAHWSEAVSRLGMRVLRNEREEICASGASFDLVGVDDHHAHFAGDGREDLAPALAGRDPERAAVLLAHDPATFTRARAQAIDLQLSGHTHGGQIWPFAWFVRLATPYVAGRYRDGRAQLYVSRGTGFWGPPLRLFAPAEITEITIRSEPSVRAVL